MAEAVLGLHEAARAAGVSVATIRRRRDALMKAGASRAGGGRDAPWLIPVSALISVGLMPRVTPPDGPPTPAVEAVMTPPADSGLTALQDEVLVLRVEVAELRAQVAAAARIEAAHLEVIDTQRTALRMLTTGHETKPAAGFWDRLRGR